MSCQSTPTQTLYRTELVTTQAVGTSTVQVLSTRPASSTTQTQSSCIATATDDTCLTWATTEVVVAIPGTIITVEDFVPFTTLQTTTNTVPTTTLFATCSESTSSHVQSTTSTSSPERSTVIKTITSNRPPPTDPTTTRGSISYGSPSVYTVAYTVTLPNGVVSSVVSTATSTPSLWVPEESAASSSSGSNIGLIVGASIGGFAALTFLAGIIWLLWRKRRIRWDDIFDERDDEDYHTPARRMELIDTEPKPYQYGVVGAQSPPGSPLGMAGMTDRDRRASAAPLLSGTYSTSHSASPSMDYLSHSSHGAQSPHLTGGSGHSRDPSLSATSSLGGGRDRMQHADDHGVIQPFIPMAVPANYYQTNDRKPRPQTYQNLPIPPNAGQGSHLGLSMAAGPSTHPNPAQLSPPPSVAPTTNRTVSSQVSHSKQPQPQPQPQPGRPAESGEPAPPPYSYSPSNTSPSTADSSSAPLMSSQRYSLANPDFGNIGYPPQPHPR